MGIMNRKQVAAELSQIRLLLREKKLLTPNNNQALMLAREIVAVRRLLQTHGEPKPGRTGRE